MLAALLSLAQARNFGYSEPLIKSVVLLHPKSSVDKSVRTIRGSLRSDLGAQVERICLEFSRQWETAASAPDLRGIVDQSLGEIPSARFFLAIELVCIDMGFRWAIPKRDNLKDDHESLPASSSESPSVIPETNPTADDYCRWLLGSENFETPLRWIEREYQIRCFQQDHRALQTVLDRYPNRSEVRLQLKNVIPSSDDNAFRASQSVNSVLLNDPRSEDLATQSPSQIHLGTQTEEYSDISAELRTIAYGSSNQSDAVALETPINRDRFELQERLGRGAFGEVWKAYDSQLRRMVAIKSPHDAYFSASVRERFLRESQAAAKLSHDGIVSVYDVCLYNNGNIASSGMPIIVSRYIDGINLAELLKRETRVGFHETAKMAADLADALLHAHLEGIVHRDLKPANILIDGLGKSYITDFGLAKDLQHTELVTQEGDLLGTAAYMAPEQASGRAHDADPRCDVYSLGVVMYELVTGERPFRGTVQMVLQQVINDSPLPPQRLHANVPKDLQTIILKCMEKVPDYRYQSAGDLRDDLLRFLNFEPIHGKPPSMLEKFVKWYPSHSTEMLGTYFIVAAMTWVFYIFGGQFESTARPGYQLSSLVFLPWAASWILLGFLILKRGFWFEILNIPVLLAFLLLPAWLNDEAQAIALVFLIGFFGLCLQVGTLTGKAARRGFNNEASIASRLSSDSRSR